MTEPHQNITLLGTCRCCKSEGYFKVMFEKHINWSGEQEIYGAMINECFNLHVLQSDVICDVCINKVREAFKFRRQIINSGPLDQQVNKEWKYNNNKTWDGSTTTRDDQGFEPYEQEVIHVKRAVRCPADVKVTPYKCKRKPVIHLMKQDATVTIGPKTRHGKSFTIQEWNNCLRSIERGVMSIDEAHYRYNIPKTLLVRRIEEMAGKPKYEIRHPLVIKRQRKSKIDPTVPRKYLYDRRKYYKKYTYEQLFASVAAIREGTMTVKQASQMYDIPEMSLVRKIRQALKEEDVKTEPPQAESQPVMVLDYEEVEYLENDHTENAQVEVETEPAVGQMEYLESDQTSGNVPAEVEIETASPTAELVYLEDDTVLKEDMNTTTDATDYVQEDFMENETNAEQMENLSNDVTVESEEELLEDWNTETYAVVVTEEAGDEPPQDTQERQYALMLPEGRSRRGAKRAPKRYKMYSEDDLREGVEAIRGGDLTLMEAEIKYKIPKRTLLRKIRSMDDIERRNGTSPNDIAEF